MSQLNIEIRKAKPTEGRFIARNVMSAVGHDVFGEPFTTEDFEILLVLSDICAMPDTLYSYRNTMVAAVGDMPVGSLTAYDGALYREMKEKTFSIVKNRLGWEPPVMDDETRPGEYYLDSLAVLPTFRGHHIAKLLVEQALETAEGLGFRLVSLIADATDKGLQQLYADMGFKEDGHLSCFGHDYIRMINQIA